MTDFIAKAREGRTIALSHHQSGTIMFFPSDIDQTANDIHRRVTGVNIPMFVRSSTMATDMTIQAPAPEQVANGPLVLDQEMRVTEEQVLDDVMRLAA